MKAAATNNVTANPYQGPATAKRSESHARKVATTQSARPKPTRCAELNCENRPLISYGALPAAPASSSPSDPDDRSEEHTSERQSLMRISYAVFCLKKNNNLHIPQDDTSTLCTDNN